MSHASHSWAQTPRRWVFLRNDTWLGTVLEEGVHTLDSAKWRCMEMKADVIMLRESYDWWLRYREQCLASAQDPAE